MALNIKYVENKLRLHTIKISACRTSKIIINVMIETRFLSYNAFSLLLVCFTTAWCFQLPPYIKRCKFDDSLPQCIIDQLPVIRPHFKEAIKELGIPVISPYYIPKLTLDVSENFKLKTTNLSILHLDEFEVKQLSVNITTYKIEITNYYQLLEFFATYDIDGKILLLPIKGHGPINISATNFTGTYSFILSPKEKNKQIYRFPTEQSFKYSVGKIIFTLGNLFNGDKVLSEQLNNFLNENWQEVELLARPTIVEIVYKIVDSVFDKVFNAAPFNELLIVS